MSEKPPTLFDVLDKAHTYMVECYRYVQAAVPACQNVALVTRHDGAIVLCFNLGAELGILPIAFADNRDEVTPSLFAGLVVTAIKQMQAQQSKKTKKTKVVH